MKSSLYENDSEEVQKGLTSFLLWKWLCFSYRLEWVWTHWIPERWCRLNHMRVGEFVYDGEGRRVGVWWRCTKDCGTFWEDA